MPAAPRQRTIDPTARSRESPRSLASPAPHPERLRGLLAGAGSFVFWGGVAVYWKQLGHVDPLELVLHRTVWSAVFLLALLGLRGQLTGLWRVLHNRRQMGTLVLSGSLLMGNWLVFLWAVEQGRLIETSLGYFLVPLCHVVLGYCLLGERPRRLQWAAIGAGALGVGWLLWRGGAVPWVALLLVGTWAPYGYVRKRAGVGALDGLCLETLLFVPLAVAWLGWLAATGRGALGHLSGYDTVLLLCSGWITAVPLLWFGYAAARIALVTLGFLQYISPSLQFLLGWLAYGEVLDPVRLQGFTGIWIGLGLYSLDGILVQARNRGHRTTAGTS